MNKLTEAELGYIAGMFDGEGHIGLGSRDNPINYKDYTIKCSIANTDKELIDYLKQTIGFGRIEILYRNNSKHKNAYCIVFRNNEAKQLLTIIMPYLVIKRNQAKLVLEFLEISTGRIGQIKKSDELVLEHELIYRELTALNKRGI